MGLKSIFSRNNGESLKGKYVLITGGAQGIGLETARQFVKAGCHLILTDINGQKLESAKQALKQSESTHIFTYEVDVSDKYAVQLLAQQVYEEVGAIDILINNAGIGHHGPMEDMTLGTWQRLVDVNLWGPLYHIYAFLPIMKEAGHGHIVNVSSGQAFFKLPTWGAYAAIKMAMGAISEILHYELQADNIKVTTVYPYMVNTGFYNDVEADSLGAKLSMKLLPLYSQKPETVAKKIFDAVRRGKRIEMVNILNNVAKGLHFLNPISNIFSRTVNFALNSPANDEWQEALNSKLQEAMIFLSGLAYSSIGSVGFRMEEVMSGEHEFTNSDKGKLPMEFKVIWGAENMMDWSNPFSPNFMSNTLHGTVTVGGLCEEAPCYGQLDLRYFSEQKIIYTFKFEVDGQAYEFIGEKRNIYPWNLPYSHTCCFGELRKEGEEEVISNSITHFHWDTVPAFIGSFEWVKY